MSERRRMMMGDKLPYDAEIEYLQSSGTQFIDTRINGGTTAGYEISYSLLSAPQPNAYAHICGSSLGDRYLTKIYINGTDGRLVAQWGNGTSVFLSQYNTSKHNIKVLNGTMVFDGTNYAVSNVGFGTYNFCIFTYYPEPELKVSMRLYGCKLWKDGTLVRDLIPVRVGQIGYLFDNITKQLFGNSGSGNFTLGRDV